MDIDKNGIVTKLEVESYFNRNKYLLCRPYVKETIDKYYSEKAKLDFDYNVVFKIFDSNKDAVLTADDINSLVFSQENSVMTQY